MESKLKHSASDLDKAKKQSDQLIQEMELNGKITDEYLKKYNINNEMLQSKDENIAKLVKEKINDKSSYEQDKAGLSAKVDALTDLNNKNTLLVTELKAKNITLEQMNVNINANTLYNSFIGNII